MAAVFHRVLFGPTKRGGSHPAALDVGGQPVVGESVEILHEGGDAQLGLERLLALGRIVGEEHREPGITMIYFVLVGSRRECHVFGDTPCRLPKVSARDDNGNLRQGADRLASPSTSSKRNANRRSC